MDKTLLNLFRPKQTQTEGGDKEEDGGEYERASLEDVVSVDGQRGRTLNKARLQSAIMVAVVAEVSV